MTNYNDKFKKLVSADLIMKISIILLLVFIPLIISFFWNENINFDNKIDDSKFGTFGDFFGGVVGSIWSLGGILLFYYALREQRKDFKTNKEALGEQIKALNLQSEEFKLQREELAQSRKIFMEQSKTIKQQRLESTYFSLIELYNKIISSLDSHTESKNYFKDFRNEFESNIADDTTKNIVNDIYIKLFYTRKEDLSHYFKTVYRIIKLIEESDIDEGEKFKYIKILRSQLSENEMLAIYYNSHSDEGGNFYKLILKYNLLKHLPSLSKGEFRKFINYAEKNKAEVLMFNNFVYRYIHHFLIELNRKIREDNFEILEKSKLISESSNLIIALSSSEINELTIIISSYNKEENYSLLDFKTDDFKNYFIQFLIDIFISSMYKEEDEFKIKGEINISEYRVNIENVNKLELNSDKGK